MCGIMLVLVSLPLIAFRIAPTPNSMPIVGAIRWDAWFADNFYEHFLNPAQWHDRLPFYGKEVEDGTVRVRSDTQDTMDKEIGFANKASLSYWAFCYYHPKSWPDADRYNYAWKLFLSSKRKGAMKFCFILQGGPHLGPKEEWSETADAFVSLLKLRTYQRVLKDRPLLFVFSCENLESHFGSVAEVKAAFDLLREKCETAGAGNPYIVAQVFDAAAGARYVEDYGFDAIGAYSAPGGGEHREYAYADLASANLQYWERFKATGKQVVPTINAGWDGRPRLTDPKQAVYYAGPWYTSPSPSELGNNLRQAIEWIRQNGTSAEANAILIYAWNETDEGGWLVPTLKEGSTRLDAIGDVLKSSKK